MKYLHCGYCCIAYMVVIVDNPKLGIVEDNLKWKGSDKKCQHLQQEVDGTYTCKIHNEHWYPETPCAEFTQIEHGDTPCRLGARRITITC